MGEEHDSWFKKALGVDVAKAVKKIESAGAAVTKAEAAAWDGTKKVVGAAAGAYDAVTPNFTESNKALGEMVDKAEASAKKGNKLAADKYQGVPVVGKVLKGAAKVSDMTTEVAGGAIKGVGDVASAGGNAFVHPIDSAKSLGEGALGIAEHVPIAPGLNTTVKGVHGLVDLARGKKDGEYGGSAKDLGKNLLLDTKQDPKTGKRSNADVDFLAGMGGGTQAWTDKPVEAATRTLVNLAPMVLGDDELMGKKAPPKGGPAIPEGPNAPRTVAGGTPGPEAPFDPSKPLDIDDIARRNPDLVRQPTNKIPARNDGTVFRNEPLPLKQGPSDLDQIRTKVADQRGGDAEFSKKHMKSKR